MLTINGKKFANTKSEALDTLFAADGTFHGLYVVKRGRGRVAVELRDLQGKRRALVSPDGVIVTAADIIDGKRVIPHYMYDLTADTRDWLGLNDVTYTQERDLGRSVIQTVIALTVA
jgi:hypothetical protein